MIYYNYIIEYKLLFFKNKKKKIFFLINLNEIKRFEYLKMIGMYLFTISFLFVHFTPLLSLHILKRNNDNMIQHLNSYIILIE
jgi:hypothetical protein